MSNTPQIRFAGFTDAWEQRKVKDIADNTYGGGTPQTSIDSYWNGEIPWIQSQDIIENQLFNVEPRKHISEEAISKSATKLVPKNSIAIVTRVGVGKLAFMPFSYCTSQDFLSLSGIQIDEKYATYSIYQMLQKEKQNVQGTSIKGITIEEMLSKKIPVPCNSDEQGAIGTFFHNLDTLITLHQRKCDALQKFKKSMLQKMFPQNGESVPEIRFAGFTDAWEQRELSDLIEENQKPVPKPDGEYVRLGIRSHAKGTFHEVVAEGEGLDVDTMYVVEANNLIVNITFAWEEAWAITSEKDAEKLVSHRFPQYRFHQGQYPMFYQYRFRNGRMKYNLELASPGGAGRNRVLNKTEFMKIPVTIPTSYEEEKKIGDLFANLDNLITLHQRKLETLQKMKKSLLQKMFV